MNNSCFNFYIYFLLNMASKQAKDALQNILEVQAGNRLSDALGDGPPVSGAQRAFKDTFNYGMIIAQHAANNIYLKLGLKAVNALGIVPAAVDIATGKSSDEISRNIVQSVGEAIGGQLAVGAAAAVGLGLGWTIVASIGVAVVAGHIAGRIYDASKFVGQALRPRQQIPDSYVTYSHGRDPFTGEGLGIRIQMRKVDPMQSFHRQKLYQIDRGTSLNDVNNYFSNYSNGNDGFGGGPFGGGPFGGGPSGGGNPFGGGSGNSSFNGLFSPYQAGSGNSNGGYNGSQSSYYGMICKLTEGYTSQSDLASALYALGLGESYNSYNGNFSFPGQGNGQIGGVATKAGVMQNLLQTDAEIENQWIISIKSKDGQAPVEFTTSQLQTVLRELSYAAFSQETFPFFSLHFNDLGVLFSVIHPAYQDTLIGQVISFLDYYMKGFLNGGIYPKGFLDNWHQSSITDRDKLKPHLIDLGKEYKKIGLQYHSLRQMMAQYGLEGDQIDQSNPIFKTKFQTSFRIISKIASVQKYSNLIEVQADFDVFYTIDVMPSYREHLEQYKQEHGRYPESHLQIQILYKQMASQIKQLMPKLPIFKRYFDLLKLITFASSYYATLKKMFKAPVFEGIHDKETLKKIYRVPKAFPPIPVRYYTFHKLNLKIGDLLKSINQSFPNQLDKILSDYLETGQSKFSQPILDFCNKNISASIKGQIQPNQDGFQMDQKYLNNVIDTFQKLLKILVSGLESKLIDFCKELNNGMKKFSPKAELISLQKINSPTMKKISEKINYIKQICQRFFTLKLSTLLQKNEKQKQQIIKKYNQQWSNYVKMDIKRKQDIKKDLTRELGEIKVKMIQNLNKQKQEVKDKLNKQTTQLINNQYKKVVNPHLYTAKITTWQNGIWAKVNTQIATIQAAIEAQKVKKTQELNQALVAAEKQNLAKWQQEFKAAEAKIAQLKKQLNTQSLKLVEQNKKQVQQSKEQMINILTKNEQDLKTITKTLIDNQKIYSINLAQKKYLNHRITIAEAGYYKEVGDNFKIIGGCGLNMSQVNVETMSMGQEKYRRYSEVANSSYEKINVVNINGKKNICFKVKCINNFDFIWTELSMLRNNSFLYPQPASIDKFIGNNEIKLLMKISDKQNVKQTQINSIKYDPAKESMQGLKIGHIACLTTQNSVNLSSIKHLLSQQDYHGNYPIHLACSKNKFAAVQQIIKIDKKYLEVKNSRGLTPLCCAVLSHDTKITELLCNSGANVNHKMQSGMTLIMLAASRGLTAISKILLSKQCSVEDVMPTGDSALHFSIRNKDTQTSLLIIQKMVNVETARNKSNSYNAFHQAAVIGNIEAIQLMLKLKKVLPNSKTDTSQTALHIASSNDHVKCVKLLVQKYGADVNAVDNNEETPLMKAIAKLSFRSAAFLAKHQKINLMDKTLSNCSILAARNNMFEVLDILKNRGEQMKKANKFQESVETILRRNGMITRYLAISGNIKLPNNSKLNLCDIKQLGPLSNKNATITQINAIIDAAISSDDIGIVNVWLDYGQNLQKVQQKLRIACERGSYRCVKAIITRHQSQINAILNQNAVLIALANSGSYSCYQILCHYIQNPNKPIDKFKNTIAHLVTTHGYLNFTKKLLKLGVNFNIANGLNIKPIDLSIENDDRQFMQFLIETYPQDKIPSFIHKPECSKLLSKATIGKLSLWKQNIAKQIGNKQKTVLFEAIKSNNLSLVQKMVNFGCNLGQKINNIYPIQLAAQDNSFKTFLYIIHNIKNDKAKVKCLSDPDFIKFLITNQRVWMLIEVFQIIDAKQRQLLKTQILLKSQFKDNIYLQQIFAKGTNLKFVQDMNIIVESISNFNHKIFAQKVKNFPINELVFDSKLKQNKLKKPLIFFLYQHNFENAIGVVADKISPKIRDQNGFGLGALMIRQSSHSKQLVEYTKKYFGKYLTEIFSELSNGLALIEVAHMLGKKQFVQQLFNLSSSLKASSIDTAGNTLLHFAVKINDYEVAKRLLAKQFINNADIKNNQKRTPLSYACEINLPHMVELLLKNKANPNLTDLDGNNCLHYAFKSKSEDSLHKDGSAKLILNIISSIDAKNRSDKTALMLCQTLDDSYMTKMLINKGANISIKDSGGMEALHYASLLNKYGNVKALIEAGANINSQAKIQAQEQGTNSSSLNTPAHCAASMGYQKILSYFYHNGADFNLKNANQQTVYQCAIQSNSRNILKLIRQIPFIFDDENSVRLLQSCCKVDNFDALLLFIEQGFNLSCIDENGRNLIHICAINSSIKCLSALLRRKISPNYRDTLGNLPIHYASQMNSISAIRILLPYSAMNERNSQGNTALHIASMKGSEVLVRYMLMRRVSYKIRNKNGLTAAHLALVTGKREIVGFFFVLGDQSLYKTDHLQQFFKIKIKQQEKIMKQMKEINEKQGKNMLFTAISLKNINILKVYLQLNLALLVNHPNKNAVMEKAKTHPESNILIQKYLKLYGGTEIKQLSKQQGQYIQNNLYLFDNQQEILDMQRIKSTEKKEINKKYLKNMGQVYDSVRVIHQLTQGSLSLFAENQLNKFLQSKVHQLSHRQSILFYIGIWNQKKQLRKKFVINILEFLKYYNSVIKQKDPNFSTKIRENFLIVFPWNLLNQKVLASIKDVFSMKNQNIKKWFLKYFQPLIIADIEVQFQKAANLWNKFMNLLKKQPKNLQYLQEPPSFNISYCFRNVKYFQDCLTVFQKPPKTLPIYNLSFLIKYLNNIATNIHEPKFSLIEKKNKYRSYSGILTQIEEFIFKNRPQGIQFILNLQQSLNQDDNKLNSWLSDEQKLILCKRCLQIVKVKQNSLNRIGLFIQMAERVIKYLGKWHFYLLFCLDRAVKCGFSTYVRICELMIDLENHMESLLLLQNPNTSLVQVEKKLNAIYIKYLQTKFPQKSEAMMKKDFTTKSQFVKYPLSQIEYKQINQMYLQIQKLSTNVSTLSNQNIKKRARQLAYVIKKSIKTFNKNNIIKSKIQLIALLRQQIRRIHKIFPYNTQIYVLLILLGQQQIQKQVLKGRIGQIRTGQGKSTIVVMLAAYLALQGDFVDIITSSPYLALRDQVKYREFFASLGLTSSCISVREGLPDKEKFDGMVLFGTNYDFQFSIMRDDIYNYGHRKTQRLGMQELVVRPCECVIVDQVDSLFVDMAFNSARLATKSPFHVSWAYQIIYKYVKQCLDKLTPPQTKILREKLQNYDNKKYKKDVDNFDDIKIERWIQRAQKAITSYQENRQYIIKVNQNTGERQVIIVDLENTGRLKIGSRWSHGLHQFVQVKHGIKPRDQSLTIASISHPAFFEQYHKILGVSGTMGTEEERLEITKIYNVDIKDIPPHFPSLRERQKLKLVQKQKFYSQIIIEINEVKKQKRPILILFKSIQESNEFSQILTKNAISHFTLNEAQKQHEGYIISKAGTQNAVTIATNTAGRGTDIILTPQSKKNGGLHVIIAFYSVNSRVEDQGLGRSGRQGQKGTCKVFTHFKDPEIEKIITAKQLQDLVKKEPQKVESLLNNLRTKKISQLSGERLISAVSQTLKYQILQRFCSTLNKIRQVMKQKQQKLQFIISAKLSQLPFQNDEMKTIYLKNKYQIDELKDNPIIENFSKILSEHLAHLTKHFTYFNNKKPFIESPANFNDGIIDNFIKIQIEYMIQQWSVVYTNEIICTSNLQKIKMERIWKNLYQNLLARYEKQTESYLIEDLVKMHIVSIREIWKK